MPNSIFISPPDAAQMLGMGLNTLYGHVADGNLACLEVGRSKRASRLCDGDYRAIQAPAGTPDDAEDRCPSAQDACDDEIWLYPRTGSPAPIEGFQRNRLYGSPRVRATAADIGSGGVSHDRYRFALLRHRRDLPKQPSGGLRPSRPPCWPNVRALIVRSRFPGCGNSYNP